MTESGNEVALTDHRRRVSWYGYTALILFLGYGRMIERLLVDSGGFWSRYGPPIIASIIAVGVVGHLKKRTSARPLFWRAMFAVLCTGIAAAAVFGVYLGVNKELISALLLVGLAAALLPGAIAMRYLYTKSLR